MSVEQTTFELERTAKQTHQVLTVEFFGDGGRSFEIMMERVKKILACGESVAWEVRAEVVPPTSSRVNKDFRIGSIELKEVE